MRFFRGLFPIALVGLLLTAFPQDAEAIELTPEEKARTLLESGKSARDAKDFDAALRFFRESHEAYASPSFEALVNLADCENALGRTASAYLHYAEYLRKVKGQTDRSADVTSAMASMVKVGPWIRFARRDLLGSKAVVQIDGIALGSVGGKVEDIPAELGNHVVTILEPEKNERTVTVQVEPGKRAMVDFRPQKSVNGGNSFQVGGQTGGDESPKPLPHWVLPAGIVFGGAGSLSTLMMGVGFASGAVRERTSLEKECALDDGNATTCDGTKIANLDARKSEIDRLSTTATGLLMAGGVLTTATVVMIVVNHKKQKDVAILPIISPGTRGVAFTGRF